MSINNSRCITHRFTDIVKDGKIEVNFNEKKF